MPQITLDVIPQGLVLQAVVGVSAPRQAILRAGGQPVALPLPIRALLDTGADTTVIDQSIIRSVGNTAGRFNADPYAVDKRDSVHLSNL